MVWCGPRGAQQPHPGPAGRVPEEVESKPFFRFPTSASMAQFQYLFTFFATCLYLLSTSLIRVITFYCVLLLVTTRSCFLTTFCYVLLSVHYLFILVICFVTFLGESWRKFTKVRESWRRLEKVGEGREGRESREMLRGCRKMQEKVRESYRKRQDEV